MSNKKEKNYREILDNWYREHSDKLKMDNEKMNEIISNTDYINRLISFLKEKKYISDEDWMYFPDIFKEEDRVKVAKIGLLYQVIDKYAINNNIHVNDYEYGNYYKVVFNDFCFDIGVKLDQGIMFFCNKYTLKEEDNIIDFNNLLNIKEKGKVLVKK